MYRTQISDEEKMGMISLVSQEWQESNDPSQDELFQSLISLVQQGVVIAFYDNSDGCVKYQANRAVTDEWLKR